MPNEVFIEAADTLELAAELITTQGHAKGIMENDKGNLCALGALVAARNIKDKMRSRHFASSFTMAQRSLVDRVGVPAFDIYDKSFLDIADEYGGVDLYFQSITQWNDAPDRTAGEVVDMLKHVAKDLRNAA